MQPWEDTQVAQRRKAALYLAILAVAAVLVVGAMLLFLGNSGGGDKSTPSPLAGASTPPSGSSSAHTSPAPSTSASKVTPSTSPTPSSTKVDCHSAAACVVPGDVGNALTAMNAYRTAHGRQSVAGRVTAQAQKCALHNGDTNACPQSYSWEPVSGRDGQAVIDKIAKNSSGTQFLLDPKIKAIEIGWAYIPGSHQYECAVVTAPTRS